MVDAGGDTLNKHILTIKTLKQQNSEALPKKKMQLLPSCIERKWP